jgi:hypothetical protein
MPFHLGCTSGASEVHLRALPGDIASSSPPSIYRKIALLFKHFRVIHVHDRAERGTKEHDYGDFHDQRTE